MIVLLLKKKDYHGIPLTVLVFLVIVMACIAYFHFHLLHYFISLSCLGKNQNVDSKMQKLKMDFIFQMNMRHCLSFFSWLHVSFEMSVTDSLFFCCKNIMLNKKHYKLTFSTIFRTVFKITCMYCVFTNISAFCILQASHSHSFASEMDLSSAMPRCS